MSVNIRGIQSEMHGGGGGLFAQGLKAHTMIGLVVTAECHGREEGGVVYFISCPTAAFVQLGIFFRIAKYSTPSAGLEYTLRALPEFADQ